MSITDEKILYRKIDNNAELLRVFSICEDIILPESIDDKKLIGVGAYVFAGESSWNRVCNKYNDIIAFGESSYTAICTNKLMSIALPSSIEYIGDYAFYDCRNLRKISLFGGVQNIGGGAFMNCGKLSEITLRTNRNEHTCLNKLLSELTKKQYLTIIFTDTNEKAVMLMPEYFEESIENGPARIFEHFTRGSGFRYRQCVSNGLINFAEYDSCFKFAMIDENEEICSEIAILRLMYPTELYAEAKLTYIAYLSENISIVLNRTVKNGNYEVTVFLCETIKPDEDILEDAILTARNKQKTEILAYLMNTKNERFGKSRRKRFEL